MTHSSTGYSWANTVQWSQIPTGPIYQSNNSHSSLPNQTIPQQTGHSQTLQEQRRDMITRLYRSILGREPDIAGLNYYLYNTHITEQQIAREMFESTEHADILAKAKDIREIIKRYEESIKKLAEMEHSLESLKVLNENYKSLLEQKTQIINQLRQQYNIAETENNNMARPQNLQNQEQLEYILPDPFEEEYSNRKGCIGWIKNWLKF